MFPPRTCHPFTSQCIGAAFLVLLSACHATCAPIGYAGDGNANNDYFREHVQPIFVAKCYSCHGPKVQTSGYRLDVREIAMAGGDFGDSAIVAGDSLASPLVEYVSNSGAEIAMPPVESRVARLTADEVRTLREWIDQGAVWPDADNGKIEDPGDWYSFRPLPATPDSNSTSLSIDHFIKAKLAEHQLEMSPSADARTIARRLYFDLIGLPPTPEALTEFESASRVDAPAAYDALVEQLLASPRYGERWARHWLDVVHYGDTHGYDKDKPRPNAWPYRDYVIRSLNVDKPYARFVEEQIAGDVLWPGSPDGIEALGFIAAGPWDFIGHAEVAESKIDGKIARHLDRDDMVANTLGTFCSVTVHCAQCHQHKFDPITQEDYYSLQAVFAALDRTELKYYRDRATQQQFIELSAKHQAATTALKELEAPLIQAAGDRYQLLTAKIAAASQPAKSGNANPEFGYHSEISNSADQTKWVQVDLGKRIAIDRVSLLPCFDDFNSIGAGFGFPVRFKIEAGDDPSFLSGVHLFEEKLDLTLTADFKNPGLQSFTTHVAKDVKLEARYVRVTATKLAPRQNDFIFALAELQVFDDAGVNAALACPVTSLDSIEAPPRWRRSNLTDSIAPAVVAQENKEELIVAREDLLESLADEATLQTRGNLSKLLKELDTKLKSLPPPNVVYAGGIHHGSGSFVGTGVIGGKPRSIHLLARGQVTQPGREVFPGALSSFTFRPAKFEVQPDAHEGARRAALAKWITDANNPLTWRSIVNRVWQYHFGRGFVDTPNDLGHNGGMPSHPELLDWLACEFRNSGGSLKDLHRMIVRSETYRQASYGHAAGEQTDASNTLLWRQNRRRLEAEAIRDSVLTVSGKLDSTMGGAGWQDFVIEHPEHSPHYEYRLADPEDAKTWRRSIYRFIVRSQTQPWMTSLDCADPSMRVDKRNESLSAIQALALLNNGFMLSQAKHFADRVAREQAELGEQVDRAYLLALGTSPSESERQRLLEFAKANGLPYLCRVLLNLNAFTFVD